VTYTIGLDVGGTKIAGGVVDETGAIVHAGRVETPAQDPAAIVRGCADLAGRLARDGGVEIDAVGVACAGFIDADRSTVLFAPNLAWRNLPLRDELAALIGLPVVIENDANAAAWGEFTHGAAEHADGMMLLTVGTGIGGGAVVRGQLLRGGYGIAGEFGHVRVVPGGLRCGCGNKGCLESYASGSALLRAARELVATGGADAIALTQRCGGDPSKLRGADVTELAEAGDIASVELLAEVGTWLGEGAASIGAVLDPDVVVIGGGVSAAGDLLLEPARTAFRRNLIGRGHRPEPEVVLATLGNDAGVIGAGELARQHLEECR
jgi:glucokinase